MAWAVVKLHVVCRNAATLSQRCNVACCNAACCVLRLRQVPEQPVEWQGRLFDWVSKYVLKQ